VDVGLTKEGDTYALTNEHIELTLKAIDQKLTGYILTGNELKQASFLIDYLSPTRRVFKTLLQFH